MKKFSLIFALVVLVSAMAFAGGGTQAAGPVSSGAYVRDPNLNAPGTFPINKTRVPLRIGVEQNAAVEDFETNYMTLLIEDRGNYDLSFEIYPTSGGAQAIELMIMAGGADLPDAVWGGWSVSVLTRYGQAGMILPLNVYYQNSAYHINKSKADWEIDPIKYITSYDGNIYGILSMTGGINNEYSANWVNIYEPWLIKLGFNMPGTIAEFETVLKAFKDRDPNGNGRADEIPLTGESGTTIGNMLNALMNPFIYTQANYWMFNNGRIDVAFNKPAWREGLRYAKSLYDQELISPLAFTQNGTQMTASISTDPATVGAFARISTSNLGLNDPKIEEYLIQQPLEGPGGKNALWNPTLPGQRMIITKNCKTPESAFMLGDFMCSEEMSVMSRYGEKGVDWLEPGPNDKGSFESLGYPAMVIPIAQWGVLQNKWYAVTGPHMLSNKWNSGAVVPPGTISVYTPLGRSMGPVVAAANKNPIVGLVYNEQEQQVMDEFHTTILEYVRESWARFVTGDLSIDRNWDSYVAEFDRMGLRDVLNVTQSAWDRMNR